MWTSKSILLVSSKLQTGLFNCTELCDLDSPLCPAPVDITIHLGFTLMTFALLGILGGPPHPSPSGAALIWSGSSSCQFYLLQLSHFLNLNHESFHSYPPSLAWNIPKASEIILLTSHQTTMWSLFIRKTCPCLSTSKTTIALRMEW